MYSAIGVERVGLCLTCINSANCIYRTKRGFDALYCEMFCIDSDLTKQKSDVNKKRPIVFESDNKDANSFMGLCSNCENCDSCQLPKPDGGVWHCEEYC